MQRLSLLLAAIAFGVAAFWVVKRQHNSPVNFVVRYSIAAHPDPVINMTFSPDGKLLVTRGKSDRTVRVWKVKDGHLAYSIAVTPAQPISFAFPSDAQSLAIAYADGSVRIFKAQNGQLLRTLQKGRQLAWQGQVLFSPDQKLLAQTWVDPLSALSVNVGDILIWRVSDGNLVRCLKVDRHIHGFAFSPDGKFLAVVSCTPSRLKVTLWDMDKWSKRSLIFAIRRSVCTYDPNEPVRFLSSQDRLAVALSHAQTLLVLNLQRKSIEHSFRASTLPYSIEPFVGVAWHPNLVCDIQGQLMAIGEIEGKSVFLHYLSDKFSRLSFLWAYDLSLRLERMAMKNLGEATQMVNIYRLSDGHKVATLSSDGWISAVAFSPDGHHLAMGHTSGKVTVWERKN